MEKGKVIFSIEYNFKAKSIQDPDEPKKYYPNFILQLYYTSIGIH